MVSHEHQGRLFEARNDLDEASRSDNRVRSLLKEVRNVW